ncbi:MAG: nickel pincer cofactor biosynthesis protein LarC [Endomicrobium sp.]|jgi:uncharacterized protein (TIGR00299 family) protein|nr:nickel pincer cofactor biosynthesis protein LarC [Endomicrobium sp.]
MKTLYLECYMGAAGDMLTAALYELLGNNDKKTFLKQINSLGLNNVSITVQSIEKNLIKGTKIHVKIHGHEEHEKNSYHIKHNHLHKNNHTNLKTIGNIISKLKISKKVKDNAINIYNTIAKAEGEAHNKPVTQIHFHEVGEIDAIIDIVSMCLLIDKVSPKQIISSPINIGKGHLHCAHGILPVPAPATANILRNIPIYTNEYDGELCTPTGAAIIKHFVNSFGQMPIMRIKKIGYGMGTRKIETLNCIRAFLGYSDKDVDAANNTVAQLQCNLDDMTGESLSFVSELLLEKDALDVFYTSIQMKKNRPGILFTCICDAGKADFFTKLILKYTSTFGVRKTICNRYILNRKISVQKTPYGNIRIKTGEGFGIKKSKPEFEDIAKIARMKNKTFDKIKKNIKLK